MLHKKEIQSVLVGGLHTNTSRISGFSLYISQERVKQQQSILRTNAQYIMAKANTFNWAMSAHSNRNCYSVLQPTSFITSLIDETYVHKIQRTIIYIASPANQTSSKS